MRAFLANPAVSTTRGNPTSIEVRKMGNGWYAAFVNGVNAGNVMLSDDETHTVSVYVEPSYRRLGVASSIYNFIEKDLGRKLQKSTHQTVAGEEFWKSRGNPKGRTENPMRDINIGDWVKTYFENDKGESESMWVRVTKIKGNRIIGKLDNEPVFKHRWTLGKTLKRGMIVAMDKEDIEDVMKKNPALLDDVIGGVAMGTGFGIASAITTPVVVKAIKEVGKGVRGNPTPEGFTPFDAGKDWAISFKDDASGVANASIVTYGFSKWMNNLRPSEYKQMVKIKGRLLKEFREGYQAGKRVRGNPTNKINKRYGPYTDYNEAQAKLLEVEEKYQFIHPRVASHIDDTYDREHGRVWWVISHTTTKRNPLSRENPSYRAIKQFGPYTDYQKAYVVLNKTEKVYRAKAPDADVYIDEEFDRQNNRMLWWVRVYTDIKKKGMNPGRNDNTSQMFEEFHGRASDSATEYDMDETYHFNLAELGDLVELVIANGKKTGTPIDFSGDDIKLAVSPDGQNLALIGGSQVLEDDLLKGLGVKGNELEKDSIALGNVAAITYHTDKQHLEGGGKAYDYEHKFGEEGGTLPTLVYDRLNQRMELVGGSYKTLTEGIRD